jgi:hypothetical protein
MRLTPRAQAPPSPARPGKKRIVSTSRFFVGELSVAERESLSERLYAIYAESCDGRSPEAFYRDLFAHDDGCVSLSHGPDGELGGFVDIRIDRFEHEGRTQAVIGGGSFFRLGYRGGREVVRLGFTETLRFMLREPRTPLAIVTRANSPASYRRFVAGLRTCYPARGQEAPPGLEALMRKVIARRGLASVDGGCWRVRSAAVPRSAERVATSASLRDDPDVRFYLESNPRFHEERSALLVWAPLDVGNVASSLARLATRALVGRLGSAPKEG